MPPCTTKCGYHLTQKSSDWFLFVRKNKDDKESKEFYYLGRIRHNADGILEEFVMPNSDATAVEIEYKLDTPICSTDITSANV